MPQVSFKLLYIGFAALIVLLVATIAIDFVPLGSANTWIALGIAATKTVLVVLIFMGLNRSDGAARMAAGAGVLWLAFALVLVMADYMSRGWHEPQSPSLRDSSHPSAFDQTRP